MKTAKRTISLLLTLLLLLTSCPLALALSGEDARGLLPDAGEEAFLIERERAAIAGTLARDEKLTGIMHTAENGARMYYVEGKTGAYGWTPARWVDASGREIPPEEQPYVSYQANAGAGETFPSSHDARDLGLITPVEAQIGGTCWAHAAAAVMETNAVKKGLFALGDVNFSEYQLVWFAFNGYCEGETDARNDGATSADLVHMMERGGNDFYVGLAVKNHTGPTQESRYALDESLGETAFIGQMQQTFTYESRFDRDLAVTEIKTYPVTKEGIKSAVLENGAAQLSYYSNNSYYSNYWNAGDVPCAYYYPTKTTTNHAVTVVGWDDGFSRENFKASSRPAHDGAWLIKNSWGTSWGNGGFFWLSYDDPSIDKIVVYEVSPLEDRENAYSHNGFMTENTRSCTAAANVFTARAHEYLTYVTSGDAPNGSYTFKIYGDLPAGAAAPDAGTLKYTQSGAAGNEKWIPVNANVDLAPGERFAVVFEDLGSVRVEGAALPTNSVIDLPVTFTSNPGESFVKTGGVWKDTNALGLNDTAVGAFTRDVGTAPYAVTFTCPGYFSQTVTTSTGSVSLPQTAGRTWVFTYQGRPFDGTGVDRDMTVTAHCYPTEGTVSEDSVCVTEFRCVYCGLEILPPETRHTEISTVVAPTREHPGHTEYTCTTCLQTRVGDRTIHPDGDGEVLENYVWQYYDGALSFAGVGALPDFAETNAARPWDAHANETVDIYIGEGLTRLGAYSFCYFNALTGISFPSTLTSVGNAAFYRCGALTEAVLPAGVTEIGLESTDAVYVYCNGIRRLVLEEGVTAVEKLVYKSNEANAKLEEVVLPSTLRSLSYVFYYYYMRSLQRYTVSEDNPSFSAVDGVLFNKNGTQLLNYPASRPGAYYKVPASVSSFGVYAFTDLNVLKYLDLSDCAANTLTNMIFDSSHTLTYLNLPANLKTIKARAFRNNSASLTRLFIPSSLTTCDSTAFTVSHPLALTSSVSLSALSNVNNANVSVTVLSGHVHDFAEVAESVPGTCLAPGYEIRVCACGQFTVVDGVGAGGHDWQWVEDVPATCVQPGVKHRECSVCHARADENTPIPATGDHKYTAEVVNDDTKFKDATCTEAARYYYSCADCGRVEKNDARTFENGAPNGHDWDWVEDVPATCVQPGVKHRECAACHAREDENTPIPATGDHKYTAEVVNDDTRFRDATCTEKARYYYSCADCGRVERNDAHTFENGAPNGHSFVFVSETPSTCAEVGHQDFRCETCGETRSDPLPKAAHTPETVPGKAASCTETGLTAGVKCGVCGVTLEAQRVIAKLPHTYGEPVTVKAPTCTGTGTAKRFCTVCGAAGETVTLKAKGHRDDNGDKVCDDCGASLKSGNECPYCGEVHSGFFGSILGFFHRIAYFFKNLF